MIIKGDELDYLLKHLSRTSLMRPSRHPKEIHIRFEEEVSKKLGII